MPEPGRTLATGRIEIGHGRTSADANRVHSVVVDCSKRTLMPGLIDCHLHVFLSEVNIRNLENMPLTLLTALGISQFMVFYKNFRKYLHAVELFSGALLLFVGGLVFVNKLTWLSSKLTFLNRFSL